MKKIYLRGAHSDKFVLVSDEDFEELNQYMWHYVARYAAGKAGGQKPRKMHRIIMNAHPGQVVDHIDRNPLNNQRENLRISTPLENNHNRGKTKAEKVCQYYGVAYNKRIGLYRAVITRFGKRIVSTSYKTEIAAAICFNRMVEENNFVAVKNNISLTVAEQDAILERDAVVLRRNKNQSGISGLLYNKTIDTWVYTVCRGGKKVYMFSRRKLEDAISEYNRLKSSTSNSRIVNEP